MFANPAAVYVKPDDWALARALAYQPKDALSPLTADQLMVLDGTGTGHVDAAWMPDSGRVCLLSAFRNSADSGSMAYESSSCVDVPARSPADAPSIVYGPRYLGLSDAHGSEWFEIVAGAREPLELRGSYPRIGPLNQRTATATNGVTYTIAHYNWGTAATQSPVIEPPDLQPPQLCTASGALCQDALTYR
ncbi:hypothetical protein [Kitasatospora sp. MMS16-BH015]|uniref:hypothetical protein n=1 Tax=Kitasatospora sp. MMS16-BH015 TaxID=2018025 RepID=UPI00131A5F49|nr:hypothetical protein [Kitasatospora sp. MMS16-BH015]